MYECPFVPGQLLQFKYEAEVGVQCQLFNCVAP